MALPAALTRSKETYQVRRSPAAPIQPTGSANGRRGHGAAPVPAPGSPTDEIYPPDQVDVRPQISQLEFPELSVFVPESESIFRIRIIIGPDGTAELVESLDPEPLPAELMALIRRAALTAQFLPAYNANRPVRSWVSLELQLPTD